jgi:cytidylate kinase
MVDQQRSLGANGGVVMEGRDIGTTVFPDAEVKIFLDAAPEVRGNRRFRQNTSTTPAQTDASNDEQQRDAQKALLEEMRERDRRDRSRAESPLRPAEDALVIDSTAMELPEVLARAEEIVLSHLGPASSVNRVG